MNTYVHTPIDQSTIVRNMNKIKDVKVIQEVFPVEYKAN